LELPLDAFDLGLAFSTTERVTGVFGPSGAGKTSLLESLAGWRRPRGRIVFGGEVWLDSEKDIFVAPEARRVGYVAQDGLLFPHLDVRGNLLSSRAARDEPEAARDHFDRVCGLLELQSLLDRSPRTLSGGERQRVALGRALCSRPALLLLDEPLGSLDLPLRRRILPLLQQVKEELRTPILLVTHDPREVLALCDRMLVVSEGRLVAEGAPVELLSDPSIWALAEDESFENVIRGVILPSTAAEDGTRLDIGGGRILQVPEVAGASGDHVLVTIAAQQILVATERPTALSARNYLPGVVHAIRPHGNLLLVSVRLGAAQPEIVAEVTRTASEELGLEPGRQVFLVIKTTGCRVLAGAAVVRGQ